MTLSEYIDSVKSKSIAVIGIGVSNTPLIELLAQNGCTSPPAISAALTHWRAKGRSCSEWA